ncbi:hypothetical protein AVEN_64179-1 [Araneus ventricosus]|uniref:Uncharacterized protein n=1 Tax=Araneus ventricosus TaxID=182803 RepID=A0A4Y2P7K5_ARAVE|nr:hypothetical protein AVEN_64179-1 [Araneus ventricosus]
MSIDIMSLNNYCSELSMDLILDITARTKKSYSSEKYKAKWRDSKKLSMRKAQEKLKDNPELLEEAQRKDRERKKEEILVEELDVNTPPQSPNPNVDPLPSTSRLESGKKVRRMERRKLRKAMKKLEEENKELLRQVEKYSGTSRYECPDIRVI